MLKDTYVIMTLPEMNLGELSAGINSDSAPEFELGVLNPHEVELLQRDRRKRLAPSMPWTLIAPTAVDELETAAEESVTWGVKAVGATNSPYDGTGIIVAVLDTGIDLNHPAFAGVVIESKNFTSEPEEDIHGHGTHCAGTIFGQDIDGMRIGVAPNIERALVGKVLGAGGSTEGIVQAINWAVNRGAHVISMSLRTDFPGYVANLIERDGLDPEPATSQALEAYRKNVNLFTEFYRHVLALRELSDGIVFVAASGNESRRPRYEIDTAPPAAATDIISVGALDNGANGYTIAKFSNNGVDLAAPGVGVISAKVGGGLVAMDGTSMATPHVAGVAALWAQQQCQETGQINSGMLEADLKAHCTTGPLHPAHKIYASVGRGLVQAPS